MSNILPISQFNGEMYRQVSASSWSDLVTGYADAEFYWDDVLANMLFFNPGATENTWTALSRGLMLFDTSSLGAGAVVTAATLSLYGCTGSYDKEDGLSIAPDLCVYAVNLASTEEVVAADFANYGTTKLANTLAFADWADGEYNIFTLNAAGLAAIDVDGITVLGIRNANYDAANNAPSPASWNGLAVERICCYTTEQGEGYEPILTLTYTAPSLSTYRKVTLEAIRNLEMTTMGRFYIDEEGKAKFESRFARNA